MFRSILTVLAVLLLAYYCSRLLGKRGIGSSGQRDLKVIEQLPVGQGRILLLKVGDHAYLVGVTHSKISLLTELEKDIQLQECYPPADGRGEKSALQKNLEKCAGNALDRAGEFLKKKADRFKAASQQGMAPYEILPGGLSAKEQPFQETLSGGLSTKGQPFQEILQRSRAAAMQSAEQTFAGPESQGQADQVPAPDVPERAPVSAALEEAPLPAALERGPATAVPERAPADAAPTGPRPLEGGEEDG